MHNIQSVSKCRALVEETALNPISFRRWNLIQSFSASLLLILAVLNVTCAQVDIFAEKKESGHDLLQAAVSVLDDKTQYFDDGLDSFPAFGFRPGSEVKQPYRLYLPEKLPAEFTLVATFKPMSNRPSYLFAVLNPFETVVQLGIRISDGPASNQNVSLVYTNSDQHSHSEDVAKFTVPKLTKKWSKIVIKVSVTNVTLYLNCHEMASQKVTRIPQELVFDTASTLYIAQAGPHIQGKYDGLLQTLKLYTGHPQDLVKCNAEFDFPSGSGSGDFEPIDGSGDVDFDAVVVSSSAADVTLSLNNSYTEVTEVTFSLNNTDTASSNIFCISANNLISFISVCFLVLSAFIFIMYSVLEAIINSKM